jgi:hypothetical protein
MLSRSSTRPKNGFFTMPTQYSFECQTGKHHFLSTIQDISLAQIYHSRTCPDLWVNPDISAPKLTAIDFERHFPDDMHYLMYDEDAEGELIDAGHNEIGHIDFRQIGLEPDRDYGLVEINEAIHDTVDLYDSVDPSVIRVPSPPSTLFLHLQTQIQELYSIDALKDRRKFSLRYGVMWQDVLSLANFSLKNRLSHSGGNDLINLIHEIMHRHDCHQIPLHKSWGSVEACIGRKIQPSNSVLKHIFLYLFKMPPILGLLLTCMHVLHFFRLCLPNSNCLLSFLELST